MSNTDALTGVANRRHLQQRLQEEVTRCQRYGDLLTVVLMDLDHFKEVNDSYGHGVGDQVLIQLAKTLVVHSRASDLVARYGGEEFILLLPQTPVETAIVVIERIRASMAACVVAPMAVCVTGSFGLTQWRHDDDPTSLVSRADAALYRAKSAGRNRFELAD